jgi:antibiotic biosynthesis monooxygenase (ABM) superfamily enzyme
LWRRVFLQNLLVVELPLMVLLNTFVAIRLMKFYGTARSRGLYAS